MSERRQIQGPDGRRLDVELAGPAAGPVVLLHVGTPSAGILYPQFVELGAERGARHVSYSRPGYGASERLAGRTVADCVADVEAVMDALGVDRFHTVGWSGGGPHALACAALLGERTISAATLAGVAPYGAEGLDFLAGMGPENVEEFSAALTGAEPLAAFLREQRDGLIAVSGAEVAESFGELLSPVDREAASGEFADYLAAALRGAVEENIWGWLDDDLAFTGDWGFALEQIRVPVTIWQGPEDRMVPFAHGQWLAAHVPGATARLLDGEGHLSIVLGHYGDMLDELLAAGG